MLRVAVTIAAKDLRQRLRDRSALVLAIVVPLALTFIFSQSLRDVTGGTFTFDYALVDLDGGPASLGFEEALLELQEQGVVELTNAETRAEGVELAGDGDVEATFVIPAGFSDSVASGRPTSVEVVGNVDAQIGTSVAESMASQFVSRVQAVRASVGTAVLNLDEPDVTALLLSAAEFPDPIVVEDFSASRKELDLNTFFAAGMAVFFLFFTVQFGITGLLEERKEGTLRRLLAAPAPKGAILLGKLLTGFVMGVVSMTVLAIASTFLLDADWGDAIGVGVLIVLGVITAIAVTSLVASFANSVEQAGSAQAVIALVFGMLGGSFFPVSQAGGFIEVLSLATPHAWFLRGLSDLQSGGSVGDIWPSILALLAFTAVTGSVAATRLGRAVRV